MESFSGCSLFTNEVEYGEGFSYDSVEAFHQQSSYLRFACNRTQRNLRNHQTCFSSSQASAYEQSSFRSFLGVSRHTDRYLNRK